MRLYYIHLHIICQGKYSANEFDIKIVLKTYDYQVCQEVCIGGFGSISVISMATPNRIRYARLRKEKVRTHIGVCSYNYLLAEAEGFEPPWAFTQTVFKTASL